MTQVNQLAPELLRQLGSGRGRLSCCNLLHNGFVLKQPWPIHLFGDGVPQPLQVELHQVGRGLGAACPLWQLGRQFIEDVADRPFVRGDPVEHSHGFSCHLAGCLAAFDVDGVAGCFQVAGVLGLGCRGQGPHLNRQLFVRRGSDVDQAHDVGRLEHLLEPRQRAVHWRGAGAGELRLLHGLDDLLGRPLASDGLFGDVADDCVINPFSRAQGHSFGGGQVTSGGLVEQPLGDAAQGHALGRQLPVQVDVLEAQVLNGHAGVPEDLGGINGCALVVLDVLQGPGHPGICCCRCVDVLDVDDREPRAVGQLEAVVAIDHIDLTRGS